MKKFVTALLVVGALALTAAPASAWSQQWTRYHCSAWFSARTNPGTVQPLAATHQVKLLAGLGPVGTQNLSKPAVKVKANAFFTTTLGIGSPGYAWRYNNLDLACYYSGGVGQSP